MTHVSLEDAASGEVSHLQEVVILLRIVRVRPDLAVNVGERIRRSVVREERRASEADRPFDLRCQEIGRRSRAAALNVRDLVILGNGGGDLKRASRRYDAPRTGREGGGERFQGSRRGDLRYRSFLFSKLSSAIILSFPSDAEAFNNTFHSLPPR